MRSCFVIDVLREYLYWDGHGLVYGPTCSAERQTLNACQAARGHKEHQESRQAFLSNTRKDTKVPRKHVKVGELGFAWRICSATGSLGKRGTTRTINWLCRYPHS